jgi:integrase
LIVSNPWHDVKVKVKVRPPKPDVAYTPKETTDIINAIPRIDARLFFTFCAVLGMRPSEVAALGWEYISDGVVKVRNAAPYGVMGDVKT